MQPLAAGIRQFLNYILSVFDSAARAPININFSLLNGSGDFNYSVFSDIKRVVQDVDRCRAIIYKPLC